MLRTSQSPMSPNSIKGTRNNFLAVDQSNKLAKSARSISSMNSVDSGEFTSEVIEKVIDKGRLVQVYLMSVIF